MDTSTNRHRHIAQLAQMACILEACAPKPGNVNRAYDFSDSTLEDFLISAIAIGPALEAAEVAGIGQMVLEAVRDTRKVVPCNTNLGLILLLAPLVKACVSALEPGDPVHIRQALSGILKSLTVDDCRLVYAAMRLAGPAGMGKVEQADISEEPSITLLRAIELARERDSVAREYVTEFAITFEIALPALKQARLQCRSLSDAIVQTFLMILSRVPDTLIARKRGWEMAREVSLQASQVLRQGGMLTARGKSTLEEMDKNLRDQAHSMNPGTTADLTAAAIFLALVESSYRRPNGAESKEEAPAFGPGPRR